MSPSRSASAGGASPPRRCLVCIPTPSPTPHSPPTVRPLMPSLHPHALLQKGSCPQAQVDQRVTAVPRHLACSVRRVASCWFPVKGDSPETSRHPALLLHAYGDSLAVTWPATTSSECQLLKIGLRSPGNRCSCATTTPHAPPGLLLQLSCPQCKVT